MLYNPNIRANDLVQYRSGSPSGFFLALETQKGWWIAIKCMETGKTITELYTCLKVVK